jgi:hypothetical protein
MLGNDSFLAESLGVGCGLTRVGLESGAPAAGEAAGTGAGAARAGDICIVEGPGAGFELLTARLPPNKMLPLLEKLRLSMSSRKRPSGMLVLMGWKSFCGGGWESLDRGLGSLGFGDCMWLSN